MTALKITDFVDYIYNDELENNKKIVYIAVGSAHHMVKIIDGKKTIETQYDQQYPLFLRNIHSKYPEYKIYIVLIDPMLEIPNYTAANKYANNNGLDNNWELSPRFNNVYINKNDNINILEFKEAVKYFNQEHYDTCINIEPQLDVLNNIAMLDKWFIILMDYTGRDLYSIANYIDNYIWNDRDHIFYGLSTRIEGGCYINLEDPVNTFIVNNDKGYLTGFTPYIYDSDELCAIYNSLQMQEDKESNLKIKQINVYFNRIIDSFKKDILTTYRRLLIHQKNILEGKEGLEIRKYEYEYASRKYNIQNFEDKIKNNIVWLINKFSEIIDEEFDFLLKIFNKPEYKVKYYEAKKIDDKYKMHSEIYNIVNQLSKNTDA